MSESEKISPKVIHPKRSRGRPPGSKNKKERPIQIPKNPTGPKSQALHEVEPNEPAFADHTVEVKEEILNDENTGNEIGFKRMLI